MLNVTEELKLKETKLQVSVRCSDTAGIIQLTENGRTRKAIGTSQNKSSDCPWLLGENKTMSFEIEKIERYLSQITEIKP